MYADADLLVVHKPAGLLVHRSALDAAETDTVMSRLRAQLPAADSQGLAPAHRLDKGTSGLLALARHPEAARWLGLCFAEGRVHKAYLALVRGWPADHLVVDHPLARDPERPSQGQTLLPAQTRIATLNRLEWPLPVDPRFASSRYALVRAWPAQGRRHQIRRHLKHAAHPIIGDATHGKGPHNRAVAAWLGHARLWLHAEQLTIPHPDGHGLWHWTLPPEAHWDAVLPSTETAPASPWPRPMP